MTIRSTSRKVLRRSVLTLLEHRERWRRVPPMVCLIMAPMRSGTHLLYQLLATPSQVYGVGERNRANGGYDLFAMAAEIQLQAPLTPEFDVPIGGGLHSSEYLHGRVVAGLRDQTPDIPVGDIYHVRDAYEACCASLSEYAVSSPSSAFS